MKEKNKTFLQEKGWQEELAVLGQLNKKYTRNLREKIREEEKEKKKSKLMASLPESDDLEITLADSE